MHRGNRKNSFIHLSGYLEMYYSYDFGKPSNHEDLYYSHKQNKVNLNLGFMNYEKNNVEEFCFNGGDIFSIIGLGTAFIAKYIMKPT
jgi:hypothetical protein